MAADRQVELSEVFPNQLYQPSVKGALLESAYIDRQFILRRRDPMDRPKEVLVESLETRLLNFYYSLLINSRPGYSVMNALCGKRIGKLRGQPDFIVIGGTSPGLLILHDELENPYPEIADVDVKSEEDQKSLTWSMRKRIDQHFSKEEIATLLEIVELHQDSPFDQEDQTLSLCFTLITSLTQWARPYIGAARTPIMEPLVAPAPLDVRSSGKKSTAGAFASDKHGAKVVTLAFHGTGTKGAHVTVGGVSTQVSDCDIVMDTSIAPYDWTARGFAGLMNGAPAPHQSVRFDGSTSGSVLTAVLGSDMAIPHTPAGQQLRVYTPNSVNRGDSGSALLTDNDELVGFAFSKTARGQPIQFASWIWARSVFNALQLK